MKTDDTNLFTRAYRFVVRRLRELLYIISSFPILLALFAIVTTALSTGAFIPLAVIVILVLLTAMEFLAHFEVKRTNWLLKSGIEPSHEAWFTEKFFSWEGAKERVVSARSWLAIAYVFLAFGLSILGLVVALLAFTSVASLLIVIGVIVLNPTSGTFHINEGGFSGALNINLDSHNFSAHFLGFDIQEGPIDGVLNWNYSSPLYLFLSILLIVATVALVPVIAKWQRELVVRFLSARSFAEIFYSSDRRRKTAVNVGSQDRSRIERDLHDGVQARLTISGIEIDRARQLAEKSEDKELEETLERAATQTAHAMQEIRNLVKGLRPALLEKGGLAAALNSLGAQQEFKVSINADIERPSPEIESALYLICSEAMTNVSRHAKASWMSIDIKSNGKLITLDIVDNGQGGAKESEGTGLKNMKDRTDSLGGEFILMSPEGGPTKIKIIVPCE
jgi:signal transduction histidine kinase